MHAIKIKTLDSGLCGLLISCDQRYRSMHDRTQTAKINVCICVSVMWYAMYV